MRRDIAKNYFFCITVILLILSGYFNYKLFKLNRYYQEGLPYFLPGESIDYLGFKIYVPQDLNRFKREFRLKFKSSQLIVCRGRTIHFAKMGEISSDEFTEILNMIRSLK